VRYKNQPCVFGSRPLLEPVINAPLREGTNCEGTDSSAAWGSLVKRVQRAYREGPNVAERERQRARARDKPAFQQRRVLG